MNGSEDDPKTPYGSVRKRQPKLPNGKVRKAISDAEVQISQVLSDGRAPDGRFSKGAKPGPGNPYNAQVQTLRRAMLSAVTPEDVSEIVATLVKEAKTGDAAAIKLLFSYCVGQPNQPVTPDRSELENTEIQDKLLGARSQLAFRENLSTTW